MKIKKDEIYAKHPLPSGEYLLTVTQGYLHPRYSDPMLVLCHTVDTGDYAYQHVLAKFKLWTGRGQARLKKMCDAIDFNWYVDETLDPLFPIQFETLRTKARVEQVHDKHRKVIYNQIIEWDVAVQDAEYNVMKPKSTDQFDSSEQKGKPDLPL